jgi:agmatine/peptidylarginine deiminase
MFNRNLREPSGSTQASDPSDPTAVGSAPWVRMAVSIAVVSAIISSAVSLGFVYLLREHRASLGTKRESPPAAVVHHAPPPAPPEADARARIPGEFEQQEALLLGCNELVQYHPETMAQIISEIYRNIRVIGLVNSEEQRAHAMQIVEEHGMPSSALHCIVVKLEGMWVQDYGPIFLKTPGNGAKILDYEYLPRDIDNSVNMLLADRFHMKRDFVPLALEGGNMLSNGRGLCLTTGGMIQVNLSRGTPMEQITQLLRDRFSFDTVCVLKALVNEPTAHVDLFCTLLTPDMVVVGSYDAQVDAENAKLLDENAAQLSKIVTSVGPMKVVRVPMPTNAGGIWRTYTNVIFANGKLLVPQYPNVDPKADAAALAIYRRLLPDWEVVGIDSSSLIVKQGALHCISLNVPWLPKDAIDPL